VRSFSLLFLSIGPPDGAPVSRRYDKVYYPNAARYEGIIGAYQ